MLRLVYRRLWPIVSYILGFSTRSYSHGAFCSGKLCSLNLPACLFTLGDSDLPYDLTSLTDLRTGVDFSVSSAFHLLLDRVVTFEFLICHIRIWKFPNLLVFSCK